MKTTLYLRGSIKTMFVKKRTWQEIVTNLKHLFTVYKLIQLRLPQLKVHFNNCQMNHDVIVVLV